MMNELSILDSLFNNSVNDGYCGAYRSAFVPKVDVKQTKAAYSLEMELPGRTENDVDIQLDHNTLVISSVKEEKPCKKEEKNADTEEKWILRERRTSEFSRSFSLPEDADKENVTAEFKNGILTVVIPRSQKAEPKRIAIKVA